MPAVRMDQLKSQIDGLCQRFTKPAHFECALVDLLESYADLTYQPGEDVASSRLVPSYHVPALVLIQLEQTLFPLVQEKPEAALSLVDLLWRNAYLEPRQIACNLLGQIPLDYIDEILDRLTRWSSPDTDSIFLRELYERGTVRIRRGDPNRLLNLIHAWIHDPNPHLQICGLHLLIPLIQDPTFEYLPSVFRLLDTVLPAPAPERQNILISIIMTLSRQAPGETRFFLQQMLSKHPNPNLVQLIRRSLSSFPSADQSALRTVLSKSSREPGRTP